MKEKANKIYSACLKMIPVCAGFMLAAVVNSTATWIRGQEKLPEQAKKYRKF